MVRVAVAYVNSGREAIYFLAGAGALLAAVIIATVAGITHDDLPGFSRLRRFLWRTGLLSAGALAAAGVIILTFWVLGSDLFLKDRPDSSSSQAVDFCSTHDCIPNFSNGQGYVVQCSDGTWSHSGGIQGACSDHGGEQ